MIGRLSSTAIASALALGAVKVNAQGGFAASCTGMQIYQGGGTNDWFLSALCPPQKQGNILRLGACIENEFENNVPAPNGNFQNNCDQCAFSTGYCGPDGCNMQCSCDLSESNPLDLNTFITNDQGIMVCNGGSGVIVGGAEG